MASTKKSASSSQLVTPAQVDSALAKLEKGIHPITAAADKIVVEDEVTKAEAAEFLTRIKETKQAAEKDRKSFVNPLNKVVDSINDRYRPNMVILKQADSTVRAKVLAFHEKQEADAAKERDRLQKLEDKKHDRAVAKAEKKGTKAPLPARQIQVAQPKTKTVSKTGSVVVRKEWKKRYIDISKIPRKYTKPDDQLLQKVMMDAVREGKEPPTIPGVEFYQDSGLSV